MYEPTFEQFILQHDIAEIQVGNTPADDISKFLENRGIDQIILYGPSKGQHQGFIKELAGKDPRISTWKHVLFPAHMGGYIDKQDRFVQKLIERCRSQFQSAPNFDLDRMECAIEFIAPPILCHVKANLTLRLDFV